MPERLVRVFVSSTFSDMQAEREELVKHIFPQLRKLCENRGVTWGEVDLRWGITDEQKAEGGVLPICLAEIQRCRPYFIGLLGERYGWVPDDIPPALADEEEWLRAHEHRSITELEILHGVLRNPGMADHSLFYFRDPSLVDRLPAHERKAFQELPTEDDIRRYGQEEADRRAAERRGKLVALKQRLRHQGLRVRENYANPKALGQLVLQDLTEIIDRLFPEGSAPAPLDREAAEHDAFSRSRARVYVGRQQYFDALDAHVQGKGPPLVVVGESGAGKSALLANWAEQERSASANQSLILHFIGSSPFSTDWSAMLRRIMGELERRFDIEGEIPDQPEELRSAFANYLHLAAAKGRVVLILDALNQLEDRDQALDLIWLPPVIPASVRLVLSTLGGRPLEAIKKRRWPTLTVEPLRIDERRDLTTRYLAQFTKTLGPVIVEQIANARQTANPLYLRTLLEELRLYGDHLTLGQRVEHYLGASEIDDLFEKILERYEHDYGPALVRDAMSLIWAARRGLSETELLDLLGSDGNRLPRALWSPLYLAAEQALVSRSGLIGFFHDYLRSAVRDRYLPDETSQHAAHTRVANYFREIEEHTARKIDELSWQLARATEWDQLCDLLGDVPYFNRCWDTNEFEVKAFWAQLEANSACRMVEAYRPVGESLARFGGQAWNVATLLHDAGHSQQALPLRAYLTDHYSAAENTDILEKSLGNQAVCMQALGDADGALALFRRQERICRQNGNSDGLHRSLGNQANILYERGDLDAAMALQEENERICREMRNNDGLQVTLGNQALILKTRGDLDGAMALHREQERLCRELGHRVGLLASLSNQANIFYERGSLDEALDLYRESERGFRELGHTPHLRACLGNQALILKARGDAPGAMALRKEEERLCRELASKDGLQISLGNQAVMLIDQGDLTGAMALLREAEQLCRELGSKDSLQGCLINQAIVLKAQDDREGALALLRESERLCRETGNAKGLATVLMNQATLLPPEEMAETLRLAQEAYRLAADHGFTALAESIKPFLDSARELGGRLQRYLGNHGRDLLDEGDLDGAMTLLKQQEQICRALGNKDDLQTSLGNQGLTILQDAHGDIEAAMALYQEQERLCRELGNQDDLQKSIGNQAVILERRGDVNAAMALHREKERICHELGNNEDLVIALFNQARLLDSEMGRPRDALPLAEEALRVAVADGFAGLSRHIEPIVEALRLRAR